MNYIKTKISNPRALLLLVTFIALLALPFFWIEPGLNYVGGDDSRLYLLYPAEWLTFISSQTWNGFSVFQEYNPTVLSMLPITAILSLLKFLIGEMYIQQYVYGIVLAGSFSLMFLFIISIFKIIVKKNDRHVFLAAYIGSLAWIFAHTITWAFWNNHLKGLFLLILFPLFGFILINLLRKVSFARMVFFALAVSVFSISLSSYPFIIPFFIGLLSLAVYLFGKKIFNAHIMLFSFLVLFFNAFWIIPLAHSLFLTESSSLVERAIFPVNEFARSLQHFYINDHSPLLGVFTLLFNIKIYANQSIANMGFYQIAEITGSFLFLTIVFGLFCSKKLNQRFQSIFIFFMTLVVMYGLFAGAVANNFSFNFLVYASDTLPGFNMLRTFWHKIPISFVFFFAVTLSLSVYALLTYLREYRYVKNIVIGTIMLCILIGGFELISGRVFEQRSVRITEYPRMSSFQSYSNNLSDRLMTFPLTLGTWTVYTDGDSSGVYVGSPVTRVREGIPTVSGYAGFRHGGQSFARIVRDAVEYQDSDLFYGLMRVLNIRYALVDYSINFREDERIAQTSEVMNYTPEQYLYLFSDHATEIERRNSFALYELDVYNSEISLSNQTYSENCSSYNFETIDEQQLRKVIFDAKLGESCYDSDQFTAVDFIKDSAHSYKVSIKNLDDIADLVFLQKYHSEWIIVPGRVAFKSQYLRGDTAFDKSHIRVAGYANAWEIDPSYIEQNFPADAYTINEDGSMDVDLVLYFRPQAYFYLGLLISGVTFIGCVGYIIVVSVRARRRRAVG